MLEARDIGCDAALIRMDNRGGESPYDELLLCFNASHAPLTFSLEGAWTVLADGEDSFRHERPFSVSGEIRLEPVSALILGHASRD